MTTTLLGSETFNFLFFLVIFIIGLDFTLSGYLVITNKVHDKRKQRLLGLWVIQKFYIPESKKKSFNSYMSFIYDFRNLGFMTFAGGILIVFGSAVMVLDYLL